VRLPPGSIAVAALLGALAGCGEKVDATVRCVTTGVPSVECEVTQTRGTREVEVCWDFEATCANGALVKAPRTCQKVKDGGTAQVTIPGTVLDGIERCEGSTPPTLAMPNMTINGRAD
jgi:hypothetical protein